MKQELHELELELQKYQQILVNLEDLIINLNSNQYEYSLNNIKTEIDNQSFLLKKKTFGIAVVSEDKSTTSSLLNAWLGYNLCSIYTTTQIKFCLNQDEQKYLIEYYTVDEYAKNDNHEINSYLNQDLQIVYFQDFQHVKSQLTAIISNPSHALAIKNIQIYLFKLNINENMIITDVPNYDSSKLNRITESDVILYVKRFTKPSLNDEIDYLLKFKDKLIILLTGSVINNILTNDTKNVDSWRILSITELNFHSDFKQLEETIQKSISNSKLIIALQFSASIKNKLKDLSTKIFCAIKNVFHIDKNSKLENILPDKEMDKIYKHWWCQKWFEIEQGFQDFYQDSIRPKQEEKELKQLYDKLVDSKFYKIETIKKERQEKIYNSLISEDGVHNPNLANLTIRNELAINFYNCLDYITDELNNFLWIKFDKMIDFIRKSLWQIPEIKQEIIGKEDINIELFKKGFEVLINNLARPAINIFIKSPRSKISRFKMIQEYQLELLALNTFSINGKLYERGLISFLANGKLGDFKIEIIKCNKKDQNPFGDDDDQFNDLTFSQNSENLTEIQNEIEQDINEFLNCMKNSIFYGSRIQRFYFSELDKFKNRFIDLEKLKGRWRYYFEIYMKKKDTQIMIPGPKLANELRQREKILIYINEITKICSSLGIQYD